MRRARWWWTASSALALLACRSDPEVSALPAALATVYRDGAPRCLGVVVRGRWVLTAKHCITDPGSEVPSAAARLQARIDGAWYTVASAHVPKGTYQHLGELHGRDVGLLTLTRETELSTCIGDASPGDALIAIRHAPDRPVASSTPVLRVERAALYASGATCEGDSGGPALTESGRVAGVASWRTRGPCGTGRSVYTRARAFEAWMAETMGADGRDWLRACRD